MNNMAPFLIKTASSLLVCSALVLASTAYGEDLSDDSLADLLSVETELKADLGSRSSAKNLLNSPVPVDAITASQIEGSGLTLLTDVLRYFIPNFNTPKSSVTDGSDHVQMFTLRGMAPDQILVLINGKRHHNSALLNVNGTIGRGSSSIDIDTIPLASIDKIEILRDGAAAQYGSDAIAGVINIVLKGTGQHNHLLLHSGIRQQRDGVHTTVEGFFTHALKYDGFVNLTLEASQQNQTQRAGLDRRVTPPVIHTHFGIPAASNLKMAINIEVPQANDTLYYSNMLLSYRDSRASPFYRTPDTTRTLFPNGFLPSIHAKILDAALTLGAKGRIFDATNWDLSNTIGQNRFGLNIDNTINYSMGAASPTSFHNGDLIFTQNTTNLDLTQEIGALNLAWGGEYRYERYQINAGDVASYALVDTTKKAGSQGFAGYTPKDAINKSRGSYALYLDGTYQLPQAITLESAVRYEHFSDFGNSANIKLASSYRVVPTLLLRISASTGFRAPSLAQQGYSQISSFISGNTLVSQGTFRVDSAIARALGAMPLQAEKSKHFTVGSVYEPTQQTSLMIDYFYTKVNGKIMISNKLSGTTAAQKAVLAANSVSSASFFTNAVNTTTQGFDLKWASAFDLASGGKLTLGAWFNYSKNSVTHFNTSIISRSSAFEAIDRLENGQPKTGLRILSSYKQEKWNLTMNINRFGSYQQVINNQAYRFNAKWTTDMDIAYHVNPETRVAIGGNNLFNTLPNKWNGLTGIGFGSNGIIPTSQYSPFGVSGAYYYLNASVDF